jgi:hypothetical protein
MDGSLLKKWSQRDATYKKRTVKTIPPHPGAGSFVRQFGGLSRFAAGLHPFQPYWALTDLGIAGRCQQAISSPILLIARLIASKKRRPRTYAELRCRVHEDLVA